jgi:hypothetical protein
MSHWYPHLESSVESEIFVVEFRSPEQTPALRLVRAELESLVREALPQVEGVHVLYLPPEDPEAMLPQIAVQFHGREVTEAGREALLSNLNQLFDEDRCYEEYDLDVRVIDDSDQWEFGEQGSGVFFALGEPIELLQAIVKSKQP